MILKNCPEPGLKGQRIPKGFETWSDYTRCRAWAMGSRGLWGWGKGWGKGSGRVGDGFGEGFGSRVSKFGVTRFVAGFM